MDKYFYNLTKHWLREHLQVNKLCGFQFGGVSFTHITVTASKYDYFILIRLK